MADSPLSVLLHHTDGTTDTRYALKADSFIVQIGKSPIQIPIPQQSPQLIDFGIFRPAITLSGIVDDVGGNSSNTTVIVGGMDSISATDGSALQTWYIPYKNKLEESLFSWMSDIANVITLQVGDPTYPVFDRNHDGVGDPSGTPQATGGSKYQVALQQVRFQLDAGREDRWIFQMQFVAAARLDTIGTVLGG